MPGFEAGWAKSPTSGSLAAAPASSAKTDVMAHRAILVSKPAKDVVKRELVRFDDFKTLPYQDPSCDVTVKVSYSNVNFKDGIVLTGGAGVAKTYPLVPGIDFAGKVLESKSPFFE